MKTLIIDGNNLLHRTYWTAKNQAKRYDNVDVSGLHIYFTINAVYSYVGKYKPDNTIVVWDEKLDYQPNQRKLEFSDYKGNRTGGDSAMYENTDVIKEMLTCLGVPSIFPRELEADDIVSYICKTYEGEKVIVSVDKDFLQLVNEHVILFDPIRKIEHTHQNFEETTNYTSEDWLAVKCLQGDKSDNVPGIKGFGKKTTHKYLQGAIILNEEQQEIFDLNYSLFSLDKIMCNKAESQYYQEQLEVPVSSDWNRFLEICNDKSFDRIVNNKQTWYTLFFLGKKLQSILG
jgi:5'-3' exonuclease